MFWENLMADKYSCVVTVCVSVCLSFQCRLKSQIVLQQSSILQAGGRVLGVYLCQTAENKNAAVTEPSRGTEWKEWKATVYVNLSHRYVCQPGMHSTHSGVERSIHHYAQGASAGRQNEWYFPHTEAISIKHSEVHCCRVSLKHT